MLLYEIADDVHWLMLTNIKHIKKVCCAPRLCTFTNATYSSGFKLIHLVLPIPDESDFVASPEPCSGSEQLICNKSAQKKYAVFFNFFFFLVTMLILFLCHCFFGIGWSNKIGNRAISNKKALNFCATFIRLCCAEVAVLA